MGFLGLFCSVGWHQDIQEELKSITSIIKICVIGWNKNGGTNGVLIRAQGTAQLPRETSKNVVMGSDFFEFALFCKMASGNFRRGIFREVVLGWE